MKSDIEVEDHEVLDREEERELIRKAQEGDIEARNNLIEHNQRLSANFVYNVSRRYGLQEGKEPDLYMEGIRGIAKAIEKFDLDIGTRFSTYAVHWIEERMVQYIKQKTDTVREPEYIQELNRKLCRHAQERGKNLREINISEAAEELEVSEDSLKRASRSMKRESESIECMSDVDKSYDLADDSDPPSTIAEERDMNNYLFDSLDHLNDRQRKVIRGRYFEDKKLREIGENLNLTRERIRQIEEEALEELRKVMEEEKVM